ncbi:hypothetical protein BG015_003030, partial [Linnemannia schmuckeri]
ALENEETDDRPSRLISDPPLPIPRATSTSPSDRVHVREDEKIMELVDGTVIGANRSQG